MNFTKDDLARFDQNISASLVYVSGDKSIRIPSICGTPREDQLQGTPYEQLCELAGRACYHSLGKGRNSADYHKHLIESKHWSVYEHAWFAITINVSNVDARRLVPLFTNLKGIKCSEMDVYGCFHVYFNVRHFLDLCTKGRFYGDALARYIVGEMRSQAIDSAFPVVLKPSSTVPFDVKPYKTRLMRPFVSLYLSCSRNASHEQVRHRFGVSQRCLSGDEVVTFENSSGSALHTRRGRSKRTIKWLHDKLRTHQRTQILKLRPRVLNENTGLFGSGKLSDVVYSGKKQCFLVELENGKSIKCTADHRIFTDRGWMTLADICAPTLRGGTVFWERSAIGVACNGSTKAIGDGRYRNKDWLYENYHVNNFTLADMALDAGCSMHTIRGWLRRHGLSKRLGESNIGKIPWNKGKSYSASRPYSAESIEKYRQSKLGDKNPQWRGGVTPEPRRKFNAWKKEFAHAVFARDGYRCVLCGIDSGSVKKSRNGRSIELHHVQPIWSRPDLACDIDNLVTVCWQCQTKVSCGREYEYASEILAAVGANHVVPRQGGEYRRWYGRRLRPHFSSIARVTDAGIIDTYDLVIEGEFHGFVANGVVVHNSTRYCDETDTPFVVHPHDKTDACDLLVRADRCRNDYSESLNSSTKWLGEYNGLGSTTARKQARGAARGYLPSNLATQMMFTADVSEWAHMLRMRMTNDADAEIRVLYNHILLELAKHPATKKLAEVRTVEAEDGAGFVIDPTDKLLDGIADG